MLQIIGLLLSSPDHISSRNDLGGYLHMVFLQGRMSSMSQRSQTKYNTLKHHKALLNKTLRHLRHKYYNNISLLIFFIRWPSEHSLKLLWIWFFFHYWAGKLFHFYLVVSRTLVDIDYTDLHSALQIKSLWNLPVTLEAHKLIKY